MQLLRRLVGVAGNRDETLTAFCGVHAYATHEIEGPIRFGKAAMLRGIAGEVVTHYDEGLSVVVADPAAKPKDITHAVNAARGSVVLLVTESEPGSETAKAIESINKSPDRCAAVISTAGGAATICDCRWGYGVKATIGENVVRGPVKAKKSRRKGRSAAAVPPVVEVTQPEPTPEPAPAPEPAPEPTSSEE